MIYKYAIIGLGATGLFTLAHLPKESLPNTIIISPDIGGDLIHLYGEVVANLTKSQLVSFMKKIPGWSTYAFELFDKYSDEQCPKLSDLALQVLLYTKPLLKHIGEYIPTKLDYLEKTSDCYVLHTVFGTLKATKVILCIGANNKALDLPIPSLPLSTALNPYILQTIIRPSDRIGVFGTSHSGTLILKNLKNLNIPNVKAFYNTEKPFYLNKDGFTEGLKQESAIIADEIVGNKWGDSLTPELIHTSNSTKFFKELSKVDYVIYAIGFESRKNFKTNFDLVFDHDSLTFKDESNLFGFGIGFPAYYVGNEGKKFFDVGYGGFIEAIQKRLPDLLK